MVRTVRGGKLRKQDCICLGVYIAKDVHAKLLEIAGEKELTLSDVVRIAIRELLANEAKAE